MRVLVNGVRLFFDVDGAALVPDGPALRRKPTLIVLHGGPGADHSTLKPWFARFADIAQVIWLDHRANGRSDDGPPEAETLAQWGDDVAGFCAALEIEHPIIYGLSFGGFVAQSAATRHPDLPARLILASTACRSVFERKYDAFEAMGGPESRRAAERFWGGAIEGDPTVVDDWDRHCRPYYNTRPQDPDGRTRMVRRAATEARFFKAEGERWRMDFRADLARVRCPTLVLAGDRDPVTPLADAEEIAASLPPNLLRYEVVAGAGHGPHRDRPAETERILRSFILEPHS
ncbi:alpha/beta hydrolase [Thalassobaculum sp.]|uniref:alpha/beta fold hydrolase n=1 Tax=Thalassobaculum sp. TaxID=2022740 RepID=UPI0032EDA5C5